MADREEAAPRPLGLLHPKLLIVEAFAGSHPLGRLLTQLVNQPGGNQSGVELRAYASIEVKPQCEAPSAGDLGIREESCLNITGSVDSLDTHQQVLTFVRAKLADAGRLHIDGVVVVGGPPCTSYSNTAARKAQATLTEAQAAYEAASAELVQLSRQPPADVDVEAFGKARATAAAKEAALDAAVRDSARAEAEGAAARATHDTLVASFLRLFKGIEAECGSSGARPAYLIMENPYSSEDRALWNRPFMTRDHLLELPDTPAGRALVKAGFTPGKNAWLRTAYQNWCCYGAAYPQKPAVIFHNLPAGALADKNCPKDCKHENPRKHSVTVENLPASESAKWPGEFGAAALQACAAAMRGAAPAGAAGVVV